MLPFTAAWLGEARPKQYCSFLGKRTMLEHTLARAARVASPSEVVTVIGQGHWRFLDEPLRVDLPGRVLEQPANRRTAPGILLPLAYVLACDPRATVAVMPSDHFILTDDAFIDRMTRGLEAAEKLEDRVVLLGMPASRPEPEYGWIRPGERLAPGVRSVAGFHEKPDAAAAHRFYRQGCLWNTFIMAAKARTLWDLAERMLPRIHERFERLRSAFGTTEEARTLQAVYRDMPEADFSRSVLQAAPEACAVLPMDGVVWDDWGRPERVLTTLHRIGRTPNFPAGLIVPAKESRKDASSLAA